MPAADAAGERLAVDELLERDVHRRLVGARPLDVSADAEELRPAVLLRANLREPLGAPLDDERHVAERFDVVDRRRAAVEAGDRRERRLEPRLRALALERLDERGLFAGLVRAGAAVHEHVAVEAAAIDVLAEMTGLVGVVDGAREDVLDVQ